MANEVPQFIQAWCTHFLSTKRLILDNFRELVLNCQKFCIPTACKRYPAVWIQDNTHHFGHWCFLHIIVHVRSPPTRAALLYCSPTRELSASHPHQPKLPQHSTTMSPNIRCLSQNKQVLGKNERNRELKVE